MRTAFFPALALAALSLAGCGKPKPLRVDHAWVRLPAVPRQPAAAYFTVHGGPEAATLIAVTTDVAITAEMHESMTSGGMASMKPIATVPVPAKTDVAFAPGGRHVMLFDLNPAIRPPRPITLTFSFSNGERILVDAASIAAGAPAPRE